MIWNVRQNERVYFAIYKHILNDFLCDAYILDILVMENYCFNVWWEMINKFSSEKSIRCKNHTNDLKLHIEIHFVYITNDLWGLRIEKCPQLNIRSQATF